jgi:hypothetical protein
VILLDPSGRRFCNGSRLIEVIMSALAMLGG